MALFQRLCKKVLISVRRKKYYSMHYKMWDYIVAHLQSDSDELINAADYISRLKSTFIKAHYDKQVYFGCFLWDLYFDKSEISCGDCPFYKLQHTTCLSPKSLYIIMRSSSSERDKRILAAKMIRDCVLMKGGK